jgi:hypothetical protein
MPRNDIRPIAAARNFAGQPAGFGKVTVFVFVWIPYARPQWADGAGICNADTAKKLRGRNGPAKRRKKQRGPPDKTPRLPCLRLPAH